MTTRLFHLWDLLTSSYWFVPTIMLIGAILLAAGALTLDYNFVDYINGLWWLYPGGAQGARLMLSTIASSVITVAGVVFSITIAALTQASSQFGPRLLRNFIRDRGNQVVLGTFVATFIYCLIVLRTIHGENGQGFVPQVSVTVAVFLALASISVLVYFIHHISVSIQAPHLVARVAADLDRAIAVVFDAPHEQQAAKPDDVDSNGQLENDLHHQGIVVVSACTGYLQAIDWKGLMNLAQSNDLVLRLEFRAGHFIQEGSPLVRYWPPHGGSPAIASQCSGSFLIGKVRTSEQDVEFAITQLVEIAVRALSPGFNDPFTAVNCIDWLGANLSRVAQSAPPSRYRYDEKGTLRIIVPVSTFGGLVDAAFNQIRQNGRGKVAIAIRLLEAIDRIAEHIREDEQRVELRRHVEMVYGDNRETIVNDRDRADLQLRYESAMERLQHRAGTENRDLAATSLTQTQ